MRLRKVLVCAIGCLVAYKMGSMAWDVAVFVRTLRFIMPTLNPKVDAYIEKQADFAKPILVHLRKVVHETCPNVTETIKWGMPSFEYQGLLCGMAAFKAHATFGFWKHDLVIGADAKSREAMGSFGRITSVDQLPSKKQFAAWMKIAMKLNEDGVKTPREKKAPKKPIPLHPKFKVALAKSKKAKETFDNFAPSCQREYLEWISEAKRDETRDKRIATAVEWLAEGKKRNWKYENC